MFYPNLIVLNESNFICLEEVFNWIISLVSRLVDSLIQAEFNTEN